MWGMQFSMHFTMVTLEQRSEVGAGLGSAGIW